MFKSNLWQMVQVTFLGYGNWSGSIRNVPGAAGFIIQSLSLQTSLSHSPPFISLAVKLQAALTSAPIQIPAALIIINSVKDWNFNSTFAAAVRPQLWSIFNADWSKKVLWILLCMIWCAHNISLQILPWSMEASIQKLEGDFVSSTLLKSWGSFSKRMCLSLRKPWSGGPSVSWYSRSSFLWSRLREFYTSY